MKTLTELQERITKFIKENPNCKAVDISASLNIPWVSVESELAGIEYSGVLIGEDEGKFILVKDER